MKRIVIAIGLLVLVACQPVVKPSSGASDLQRQIERELALQDQDKWGFRGRVAISDGNQAGSVKMLWRQEGNKFDIEISLPISSQKYRLRNGEGKVRLESHGLVTIEGDSAEAVLMQVTGWRIPFDEMQLWLRGMRANRSTAIVFGPSGLPAQFRENGWLVDYRAWNSAILPMPTKVFANTGNGSASASVRLQIESWEVR